MANSILDLNPMEIPEVREVPEGEYSGTVVDYVIKQASTGTDYVQFSFRINEPLSGQDMTNVETNLRVFSQRIYMTENSLKRVNKILGRFGVPMVPGYREWIDAIPGTPVNFTVSIETNKDTGREYRVVSNWSAAS